MVNPHDGYCNHYCYVLFICIFFIYILFMFGIITYFYFYVTILIEASIILFQMLFCEPWRLQLMLVVSHSVCTFLHLAFLVTLQQWQQLLATAFVLASSYAALFILLRDFLILKKVYKFEQMNQGKLCS